MQTTRNALVLLAGLITAQSGLAQSEQNSSTLSQYVPGFTYDFSVRYRHESVSQDNALEDAVASTARSRLTLGAKPVDKLSLVLEIDNVSSIGGDHYDSFVLDEYSGSYSVIADPLGTEVNRASVAYSINDAYSAELGRQRILHANQRFVGGVGWRQNEQTYDALSFRRRSAVLDIDYSYVWNVNRIFQAKKPSVQITDFDSKSHFLLAAYKAGWGTLSAYTYALDFENAAALSSLTYGISYANKIGIVDFNLSLAEQSDYADNHTDYDATYLAFDAATDIGPVRALLGYEMLGSDDGVTSFKTPLATLHAYQGWTDLFLNTPASGIKDTYLTLSTKLAEVSLAATYHALQAEWGGADYGNEWDLSANYSFNSIVSTQLKFATYESDGFAVDTDKLWLTVNLNF